MREKEVRVLEVKIRITKNMIKTQMEIIFFLIFRTKRSKKALLVYFVSLYEVYIYMFERYT